MNQVKIGKFISDERKAKGYTQKQLSELIFMEEWIQAGKRVWYPLSWIARGRRCIIFFV